MTRPGKLVLGAGLGCAGLIVLLLVGLITLLVVMPSAEVLPGSAVPADDLQTLRKLKILGADEKPIYFFTSGILGPEEGGSFFSERRVVAYQRGDADETLEEAAWTDIAGLDVAYSDNWLDDTVITVTRTDKTEFVLTVSNSEHGDRRFYNRLMKEWRKKTGTAEPAAAGKAEADDSDE